MGVCIICNDPSKNTGRPVDAKPFGVVGQMLAVALNADDGTEFEIDLSADFDQAALDAHINNVDKSKRWYPLNEVENWDGAPKSETEFQEFNSKNKSKLSDGIRSASCVIAQTVSKYAGQLKEVGECRKIGMFFVDSCGNVRGNVRKTGFLKPIRIAQNTWDAILLWAVDGSNAQNTSIKFDFNKLEKDGDLGHIASSSITADLTLAEGLRDVTFENAVLTASDDTLVVDMKTIYGDAKDLEGVKGILAGDLTATANELPAVILSVTEGTNGFYTIVFTTDILVAQAYTITGLKDGLEFTLFSGVAAA